MLQSPDIKGSIEHLVSALVDQRVKEILEQNKISKVSSPRGPSMREQLPFHVDHDFVERQRLFHELTMKYECSLLREQELLNELKVQRQCHKRQVQEVL